MKTALAKRIGLVAAGVALAGFAVLADPANARRGGYCPDGWVPSTAPGGCSPGSMTANPKGGLSKAKGSKARRLRPCPKGWVRGPQGCQPGSFKAKR